MLFRNSMHSYTIYTEVLYVLHHIIAQVYTKPTQGPLTGNEKSPCNRWQVVNLSAMELGDRLGAEMISKKAKS